MKTREIVMRCLKARVVSWLTVSPQAVMLPGGYVLAVYCNGKFIEPEVVRIPDGVPPEWGPDGPIQPPPGSGGGAPEPEEGNDGDSAENG
jgi:hypothetical protein